MNIYLENLDYYLDLLETCQGVAQNTTWHPEGDVMQHTLQVLEAALHESDDVELIVAALLHDIGKVEHSFGHADRALDMLDGRICEKVRWLIANHMRIWKLMTGEMVKRQKIEELIHHPWLPELVLLARWDKLGRDPTKKLIYDRQEIKGRLTALLKVEGGP